MRSLPSRTFAALMLPAFCGVVSLLAPAGAFAHEGHGHPEMQTGPLHYLASPVHFVPGVFGVGAAVAAVIFGIRKIRRTKRQRVVERKS